MRKSSRLLGATLAAALLAACSSGGSSIPVAQSGGTDQTPAIRLSVNSPFALYEHGRLVRNAHVMPTREGYERMRAFLRVSAKRASNLAYRGGPVQTTPSIYVVYWGWSSATDTSADPNGEATYSNNFLGNAGGSSWMNIDHQYYQSPGASLCPSGPSASYCVGNPSNQLKGEWYDPSSVPSSPTDAQVAAEANAAANHFGVHSYGVSIVVALPTGHDPSGFRTSWCAYHSYNSTYGIAYTNFPYQTDAGTSCGENFINSGNAGLLDGVSVVGGHEYAETQTDPQAGNGWVDRRGSEIGDKCAWSSASGDISLGGKSYAVQPLWSNAVNGCALSY